MTEGGEDDCWQSGCLSSSAWRGMAGEKREVTANRIRPVQMEPHQTTNPPDGYDRSAQVEQIYGCGIVFSFFL